MAENLLSKEQLSEERKESLFYTRLNDSKNIRSRSPSPIEVTVFLSHKHDETTILENVINMLKKLGINVYVDWMDESMPQKTSAITAMQIRQKIRNCKKFIFLATEGAIASKWCNWELGYGDAQKYSEHIAIMPITDTRGGTFSGSEYLQIYPIIKTEDQYASSAYYVDYGITKVKLEDWLKR